MPAEPIKDKKKVREMMEVLASRQNGFRDALFFEFALSSALRVSDILALTKRDIRDGIVRVKTQKTGVYKQIALNDACRRKLEVYLEAKKDDDRIFSFERQWAHKMIKWAADMVGLDVRYISMHTTRKTAAWHFYMDSGKDIAKTQEFLGHQSAKETMAYLMISNDEVNDQLRMMSWS